MQTSIDLNPMFKWARAYKFNVNTKNKLSKYYKTASKIDMSKRRAEVSHLAGLFCFYKSQLIHEFA